jgi:hypothetical protein
LFAVADLIAAERRHRLGVDVASLAGWCRHVQEKRLIWIGGWAGVGQDPHQIGAELLDDL